MERYLRRITMSLVCFLSLGLQAQERSIQEDYWLDKYLSVSYPLKSIHITSSYGTRIDPFTGKPKLHNGIDLSAKYEKVFAMFDGKISKAGYDPVSGNFITLQAGNYTISYCHLSEVWVRETEMVYAGQVLGISGSTGRSTAPHLHLSSRLMGKPHDPYNLLTFVRDTKQRAVEALGLEQGKALSPEDFLQKYASMAMRQQQRYGIPSSVILAQMAFESGWGNSKLAQAGHNFFGIKASQSWLQQGLPYSLHDDDKPQEKFCNLSSPAESMEYHSRLLMRERNKKCRQYAPTDFHNWLTCIKAAGYATSKDYVRKCERIILRYKLYLYDQMAEQM